MLKAQIEGEDGDSVVACQKGEQIHADNHNASSTLRRRPESSCLEVVPVKGSARSIDIMLIENRLQRRTASCLCDRI